MSALPITPPQPRRDLAGVTRDALGLHMVIAAGGTGGHLTPAAALAAVLCERGHRVTLMHDARSTDLAARLFAEHDRIILPSAGVAGRSAAQAVRGLLAIGRGTAQARALLGDAAAIIGFGGYPSVAPVLAARLRHRRPRIVLHEQNAVLGGANRALARVADAVALSHARTARVPRGARTVLTGNPVRPEIVAQANAPYDAIGPEIQLLVLGGSLGARVFSDVVPPGLAALPDALRYRLRVTQQCRAEDIERVRAAYASAGIRAELDSFFDDTATLLARAHLVIARAGASTVAELAVIGRPAILVPLPGAVDADQMLNARAFADAGAGWVFAQSAFSPDALTRHLADILDRPLAPLAALAASLGRPAAAQALADLVEATVARRGEDA